MGQPPLVEIRDLRKVYGGIFTRRRVEALKGISLKISEGEVHGLLGPNGSGKTTTIKLLLGLIRPTSGTLRLFDQPAGNLAAKRQIGFLPEETYLYKFLNADETLDFYGRIFGLDRATRRREADRLIKLVGLDRDRRRRLKTYSKGMTRRIGLAQALINDPKLIILDEPTSGLDPVGTREVKDLILDCKRAGKTVLLSSHLLANVQDVCDRITILKQGLVVKEGRVEDLLADQRLLELLVADLPAAELEPIRELLASRGARLVKSGHPITTLEDLFLRTVQEQRDDRDPGGR